MPLRDASSRYVTLPVTCYNGGFFPALGCGVGAINRHIRVVVRDCYGDSVTSAGHVYSVMSLTAWFNRSGHAFSSLTTGGQHVRAATGQQSAPQRLQPARGGVWKVEPGTPGSTRRRAGGSRHTHKRVRGCGTRPLRGRMADCGLNGHRKGRRCVWLAANQRPRSWLGLTATRS